MPLSALAGLLDNDPGVNEEILSALKGVAGSEDEARRYYEVLRRYGLLDEKGNAAESWSIEMDGKDMTLAEIKKILEGDGKGAFAPDASVTREQFAAILYRYAQTKDKGFTGSWMFLLDHPDAAQVSAWADEAVHWCVMNGIINGKDGKIVPKGNATRAEVATMLMRFKKIG